jgi:prepilin-type N-terminal cleavage/methylation domain-containing protein
MKKQLLTDAAQRTSRAFTLTELLISLVVVAMVILMVAQLMNSATAITRTGSKHIDTDTQARVVLDRMAIDFAQMLKRTDVDYYFKGGDTKYPGHSGDHKKGGGGGGQTDLNDYIAFYSQVPGYSSGSPSPISLVAYRVNGLSTSAAYNKLERRGEGLLWNGISNLNLNNAGAKPIFFLTTTSSFLIQDIWPAVTNNNTNPNKDQPYYETIGPGVFRFEYYYQLKSGALTDTPWDTDAGHTSINGLTDVEAIGVTIAVIDPQSRSLLSNGDPTEQNLLNLQDQMNDFRTAPGRGGGSAKKFGDVAYQWNQVITDPVTYPITAAMPRAALSAIRIYSRYFDLRKL